MSHPKLPAVVTSQPTELNKIHERRILEGLFPPEGQSDHHDGHGCNEIHDRYNLGYTIGMPNHTTRVLRIVQHS